MLDTLASKAITNRSPPSKDTSEKLTVWQKVKNELIHYKDGFKLLFIEFRISTKLLFKMMKGYDLSRREQRQLSRTISDLKRLVPFLVFVIVPFMEFLLPVFVKLFPNMLPSTFESKKSKEDKIKKLFRARVEVLQFLNKQIYENIKQGQYKNKEAAEEFGQMFQKIRNSEEKPSVETIIRISKGLKEDITLDDLPRVQLVSLCKYLNIKNYFANDSLLKLQIRNKMRYLRADDRMINAEGIDSLTTSELVNACQQRGITTLNRTVDQLRKDMENWLTLNLKHNIPIILLIMAQSFHLPNGLNDKSSSRISVEALHDTLLSLPDDLIRETHLDVSKETGGKIDLKKKIKIIEEQEEKIEDENEQKEEEDKTNEKKNKKIN